MANLRDRIILFPRYTTFAGEGDFITLPINVSGYESGDVMIWIGDIVGPTTPGLITAAFEESTDQAHWATCGGTGSMPMTAQQETRLVPTFTKPWMRFRLIFDPGVGGKPVVTGYAVGYLERRKGASPP